MAMLKNMVTSLIKHERIMTTTARAKELRRVAEKLVTCAKKGTEHSKRTAQGMVQERPALEKLFSIIGPRYTDRNGGYTRVMKLGLPRVGDSSDMSFIEFVDRDGELRRARPVGKAKELADLQAKLTKATTPAGGAFMAAVKNFAPEK